MVIEVLSSSESTSSFAIWAVSMRRIPSGAIVISEVLEVSGGFLGASAS